MITCVLHELDSLSHSDEDFDDNGPDPEEALDSSDTPHSQSRIRPYDRAFYLFQDSFFSLHLIIFPATEGPR